MAESYFVRCDELRTTDCLCSHPNSRAYHHSPLLTAVFRWECDLEHLVYLFTCRTLLLLKPPCGSPELLHQATGGLHHPLAVPKSHPQPQPTARVRLTAVTSSVCISCVGETGWRVPVCVWLTPRSPASCRCSYTVTENRILRKASLPSPPQAMPEASQRCD